MNISETDFNAINDDTVHAHFLDVYYGLTPYERALDLYKYLDLKVQLTFSEMLDKPRTRSLITEKTLACYKKFCYEVHLPMITPRQVLCVVNEVNTEKLKQAMRVRVNHTADLVRRHLESTGEDRLFQ